MPSVEEIKRIRKMIWEKKPDLVISRVPKPTLERFKKLANDEFAGDYGMALKWCFDYSTLIYPSLIDIVSILNEHETRIAKLEGKPSQRKIRLLSGKVLEVNRNE